MRLICRRGQRRILSQSLILLKNRIFPCQDISGDKEDIPSAMVVSQGVIENTLLNDLGA